MFSKDEIEAYKKNPLTKFKVTLRTAEGKTVTKCIGRAVNEQDAITTAKQLYIGATIISCEKE